MGHHGNHLEFCEQSENCFWGPKIFLIKYMTKKEHFEKKFLGTLWGVAFITPKNDGFLERAKNLYKVSSYLGSKNVLKFLS